MDKIFLLYYAYGEKIPIILIYADSPSDRGYFNIMKAGVQQLKINTHVNKWLWVSPVKIKVQNKSPKNIWTILYFTSKC